MGLTYSIADLCLLDGFQAMSEVARRRLKVLSDKNADNIGVTFYAVVTPGATVNVETELQKDPRFIMSAEVRAEDDPLLESQAMVQDDTGHRWVLVIIERNSASPISKMWFLQREAVDT